MSQPCQTEDSIITEKGLIRGEMRNTVSENDPRSVSHSSRARLRKCAPSVLDARFGSTANTGFLRQMPCRASRNRNRGQSSLLIGSEIALVTSQCHTPTFALVARHLLIHIELSRSQCTRLPALPPFVFKLSRCSKPSRRWPRSVSPTLTLIALPDTSS